MAAVLALTVTLAVLAGQRQALTLALARNPQLLPRETGNGQIANFFSAYLANHAATPGTVHLRLHNADGVELRGPAEAIPLAPNEKRRIDFVLLTSAGRLTRPLPVTLQLVDGDGKIQGAADVYLTGIMPPAGGRTS